MSRRRPNVVRKGTPREIARHASGYAGDGVSQHSHRAARGDRVVTVNDSPRDEPKPHVHLLAHQLIAKNDRELSHIQKRLLTEVDPERRKVLERNLRIKKVFLSKLYAQQMKDKRHAVQER